MAAVAAKPAVSSTEPQNNQFVIAGPSSIGVTSEPRNSPKHMANMSMPVATPSSSRRPAIWGSAVRLATGTPYPIKPISAAPTQRSASDCVSIRNVAGPLTAKATMRNGLVRPVRSINRPAIGEDAAASKPGNELANPDREAFMPCPYRNVGA